MSGRKAYRWFSPGRNRLNHGELFVVRVQIRQVRFRAPGVLCTEEMEIMAVLLRVQGAVEYGHFQEFLQGVRLWLKYRRDHQWTVPKIWIAMTGPMNHVSMEFEYASANQIEIEERESGKDAGYGAVAAQMFFRENSLVHELYRDEVFD